MNKGQQCPRFLHYRFLSPSWRKLRGSFLGIHVVQANHSIPFLYR